MAKLISKHVGIIASIQPTEWVENMEEWAWRKKYENFLGIIHIYQSKRKNPSQYFLAAYDLELDCLTTGIGKLTYEDELLTLKTRNSIYTVKLIYTDEKAGE